MLFQLLCIHWLLLKSSLTPNLTLTIDLLGGDTLTNELPDQNNSSLFLIGILSTELILHQVNIVRIYKKFGNTNQDSELVC